MTNPKNRRQTEPQSDIEYNGAEAVPFRQDPAG